MVNDVVFYFLHLALLVVVVIGVFQQLVKPPFMKISQWLHALLGRKVGMPSIQLFRKSWESFALAWSVTSVLYIELVTNFTPLCLKPYSAILLLVDVAALFWLSFYSRWYRNKIAGIVNHREKTPE